VPPFEKVGTGASFPEHSKRPGCQARRSSNVFTSSMSSSGRDNERRRNRRAPGARHASLGHVPMVGDPHAPRISNIPYFYRTTALCGR